MTQRVQLQPAYLLHRRPFRDSSQLLELLTLDFGRVSLVAKGVSRRRRGGSLSALLQPCRPLLVSFSSRSDLGTLTGVEAGGEVSMPSGERLYSVLYVNELLTRLLHRHEAHRQLFGRYSQTLEALGAPGDVAATLRHFEFTLLDELGYGIDLSCEVDHGQSLDPDALYRVEAETGVRPAYEVREGEVDLFRGADLLAIGEGSVDGPQARVAKRLARQLLRPHLGTEPLQSRGLFSPPRPTEDVA